MKPKQTKDIVDELLAAIPKQYENPRTQLVYQYGYLIGLLSYICKDDFYAKNIVQSKINQLTKKK